MVTSGSKFTHTKYNLILITKSIAIEKTQTNGLRNRDANSAQLPRLY